MPKEKRDRKKMGTAFIYPAGRPKKAGCQTFIYRYFIVWRRGSICATVTKTTPSIVKLCTSLVD
ncbi:unnamed protein product [Chondrus crispus]|uniref:Uncharacterized protein n=1 Tax=Chondrus crispus TaxID=2769 RepID=R7QCN7_CHOCR|nr:unnamed protein product [Chondrus crispus]CDF35513.1 unnamed protein product [Chondrus crispus]|eukprot:XP_005715332.1 unnamed protein product [Chondrus crispus]